MNRSTDGILTQRPVYVKLISRKTADMQQHTGGVYLKGQSMIKAAAFDLGGTLVNYPLYWRPLYRPALEKAASDCNIALTEEMFTSACDILMKYNVRETPREHEVTSDKIFTEIMSAWGCQADIESIKAAFFSFFNADAVPFPEAREALLYLKQAGTKTGILTDAPYGMDNKFALQGISDFSELIDFFVSSVDAGYRKPHGAGYLKLLEHFAVSPDEMLYIGDEEKDVIGANKLGIISVLINRSDIKKDFGQTYTVNSLIEIQRIINAAQ